MALPKRRTPKAKRGSRRSHDKIQIPNLVPDRSTGGWKVSHTAGGIRDRKGRLVDDEIENQNSGN